MFRSDGRRCVELTRLSAAGRGGAGRLSRPASAKPSILAVLRRRSRSSWRAQVVPAPAAASRQALAQRAARRPVGGRPAPASAARPFQAVPGARDSGRSAAAAPAAAVQKGLELGAVGAVVLRVDLPDERPAGPQRAHQRVLAAHEVEVAGPQQVVEVGLASAGQGDGTRRPRGSAGRAARRSLRAARRRAVTSSSVGCVGQARRAAPAAARVRSRTAEISARRRRRDALPAQPGRAVEAACRAARSGSRSRPPVAREARVEEVLGQPGAGPAHAARAGRGCARHRARRSGIPG